MLLFQEICYCSAHLLSKMEYLKSSQSLTFCSAIYTKLFIQTGISILYCVLCMSLTYIRYRNGTDMVFVCIRQWFVDQGKEKAETANLISFPSNNFFLYFVSILYFQCVPERFINKCVYVRMYFMYNVVQK